MPKLVDWTGKRIGRLSVLGRNTTAPQKGVMWDCVCDCGTRVVRAAKWINQSPNASCGCFVKEHLVNRITKHGKSRSPEYRVWVGMISRCYRKSCAAYYKYGARGITVCDAWKNSFEAFFADMGERPSPKHTIDRIDGTKGYSPENCRWATPHQQQRNIKSNVFINYAGYKYTAGDWAKIVGINAKTIQTRMCRLKWTPEEAITLPLHFHHKHKRKAEQP